MVLDLKQEMAWVTFLNEGWETVWHPVVDDDGQHLAWDAEAIMDLCRTRFNNINNWVSFGIAPTSQMILFNAVRDNL